MEEDYFNDGFSITGREPVKPNQAETSNTISNTPEHPYRKNLIIGIFLIAIFVMVFNVYQLYSLNNGFLQATALTADQPASALEEVMTGMVAAARPSPPSTGSTGIDGIDILPKGIPDIYGKELVVSFDDISAATPEKAQQTLNKLGQLDQKIVLSGTGLKRYIAIASQISCEYCCGAESIIFKNGEAACGCAHSAAIRGLAKYLIVNHANEYSDEQILEELGKWKVLFFPAQLTQKAAVLQARGIELNYVNLASNKYRGAELETGKATGNR